MKPCLNPNLNRVRMLVYIGPYYVSWVADAAWLDRKLWSWASRQVYPDFAVKHEPGDAIIRKAAPQYEKILRWCLWVGSELALLLTTSGYLLVARYKQIVVRVDRK